MQPTFCWFGLTNVTAILIAESITIFVAGYSILVYPFKFYFKRRQKAIINHNLIPYFTPSEIYQAEKYFIATKFQNESPSNEEEPSRLYSATAKSELIPTMLKNYINKPDANGRYHLFLADTGMGKTTFLINLFLKCKSRYPLPWKNSSSEIYLFPLGEPNVLDEIRNLQNTSNAVLLLDAFDEDTEAMKDWKSRFQEVLKATYKFRQVIITCRTQFFADEKSEEIIPDVFTYGSENKLRIKKLYISVFDDNDVKRYLRLRYPLLHFWKWSKLVKAEKIVKKIPNLIVRPMLLGHIDDLVDSGQSFKYSYELYQILIEKWVERESRKPIIIKRFKESQYQIKLFEFSRRLAIDIYKNAEWRGGYIIHNTSSFETDGLSLKDLDKNYFEMTKADKKVRSLLNRNSGGYYKFSHKSVLEYFVAYQIIEDSEFCLEDGFRNLELAEMFYKEMLHDMLIRANGYYVLNGATEKMKMETLDICDLDNLHTVVMVNGNYFNTMAFRYLNVSNIKFINPSRYIMLYLMYLDENVLTEMAQSTIGLKSDELSGIEKLIELKRKVINNKFKNLNVVSLANHLRNKSFSLPQLFQFLEYYTFLDTPRSISKRNVYNIDLKKESITFVSLYKLIERVELNALLAGIETVLEDRFAEMTSLIEQANKLKHFNRNCNVLC